MLSIVTVNNIPCCYSSTHSFEESIPEGMVQACILIFPSGNFPEELKEPETIGKSEGASQQEQSRGKLQKTKYRNKSGALKTTPFNKQIVAPHITSPTDAVLLWHRQLAHASLPAVKQFMSSFEPNIKISGINNIDFCDVCVRTKLTTKAHDQIRTLPTRPAEIIAADIIRPISPMTSNRYKFVLTMIDVFSKFAQTFLLRRKSETAQYIKVFLDMTRAQFPNHGQVWLFTTDNGTEFVNAAVQKLLREYGIEHRVTELDVSAHNGVVERFKQTIEVKTKSLLAESGFSLNF